MAKKELLPPQVIERRKLRQAPSTITEKGLDKLSRLLHSLFTLMRNPYLLFLLLILVAAFVPVAMAVSSSRSRNRPLAALPPIGYSPNCSFFKEQRRANFTNSIQQQWNKIQEKTPALIPALRLWSSSPKAEIVVKCDDQHNSLKFLSGYYSHQMNQVGLYHDVAEERIEDFLREEAAFHAAFGTKYKHPFVFYNNQSEKNQYIAACLKSLNRLTLIALMDKDPILKVSYPSNPNYEGIEKDYINKVINKIDTISLFSIMTLPFPAIEGQEVINPHFPYSFKVIKNHGKREYQGQVGNMVTVEIIGTTQQKMSGLAMIIEEKKYQLTSGSHYQFSSGSDPFYNEVGSFLVGTFFKTTNFAKTLLPEFYDYYSKVFPEENMNEVPSGRKHQHLEL